MYSSVGGPIKRLDLQRTYRYMAEPFGLCSYMMGLPLRCKLQSLSIYTGQPQRDVKFENS